MTDKEIEAGIERACECDCVSPSTGWTVNPFPIIRDYIERLKHHAKVAERAFDNAMKVSHEILSAIFPNIKIGLYEWKKDILAIAEKEPAEEKNNDREREDD